MSLQHQNIDRNSGTRFDRCLRLLRGRGGFIRTVLAFVMLVLLPVAGFLAIWAGFDLVFARHPTAEIVNGVGQSVGLLVFLGVYIGAIGVVITLATRLAENLSPSRGIARVVASVTSFILCGWAFFGIGWLSNMHIGVFVLLLALSVFAAYVAIPSTRNA